MLPEQYKTVNKGRWLVRQFAMYGWLSALTESQTGYNQLLHSSCLTNHLNTPASRLMVGLSLVDKVLPWKPS